MTPSDLAPGFKLSHYCSGVVVVLGLLPACIGRWVGRLSRRRSAGEWHAGCPHGRMARLSFALRDPRVWRLGALLISLVLAACQNNDGGGGAPGY